MRTKAVWERGDTGQSWFRIQSKRSGAEIAKAFCKGVIRLRGKGSGLSNDSRKGRR